MKPATRTPPFTPRDRAWNTLHASEISVPLIEDSEISPDDLRALVGRLDTMPPNPEDAEAASHTIRALRRHIEDVYDAVDEADTALSEVLAEDHAAEERDAAAEAVVTAVRAFFATIEHGDRDPLFLKIARIDRDEIMRALDRWEKERP